MGPLGGLGGVGVDVDVGGFTSSPPLGKESSSTRSRLHLHDMARGPPH